MSTPYVPDPAIGTMTTADRATVDADNAALVESASEINVDSVRDGARFSWQKLEFPGHILVVGKAFGYRHLNWIVDGTGKPIVFDDEPAPAYTYDENPLTVGTGHYATAGLITTESQNFINTIAVLPVPAWTASGAATPALRLRRLAVSIQILTNEATTEDAATAGKKIYPGDADLAQQLVVRAHRISYSGLRQQLHAPESVNPVYMDHVSESVDAWKCGSLTGMRARARSKAFVDNVPAATLHPLAYGGEPTGKTYGSFCATALLAGQSLAARQNLAAGDAIIVSVTGPPKIIYAGQDTFSTSKRNVVFPVRGAIVVGVFTGEYAN